MRNFKLIVLSGIVFVCLNLSLTNSAQAQEKEKKSIYERILEKKNKANRRLKRRGDKSKKGKQKFTRFKTRSRQGDHAYKGDITGRKVRRISPSRSSRAAYSKPDPYAGRKRTSEASRAKAFNRTIRYSKRSGEKAWKGNISGDRIRTKGFKSEKRRLTPKRISHLSISNKKERDGARFSGKKFTGIRSITGNFKKPPKKTRIVPRSASGSYQVRKRKKPYLWRERSKWESAYKGDITGRKFRTKRTLDRPSIQAPPNVKYSNRGRGDKAYKGSITGGYRSATRPRERAWKNDISGHKLRIRTSPSPKFSRKSGGNYRTTGRKSERFGGGAIKVRQPTGQDLRTAKFQGNVKGRKPFKGGGSISGKRWNNNGSAIRGKQPTGQDLNTARFQGNIKGRKPLKGGGSISGTRWNNNGNAIRGKQPTGQDLKTARFQGNIKGGKPLKGGGSISGKRWNNNGKAIQGRGLKSQDLKTARFQGNIKAGKPKTGGGSISGKRWNNGGIAVTRKKYSEQDRNTSGFSGNIKQWKFKTGPLDEMKYTGSQKRGRYQKNPKAADGSLKIIRPKTDQAMANHSGTIKQWKYKTGPLDEMKFTGNLKRPKYKHNKMAADEALKVRTPGKSYYKAGNFQGRFKRDWTAKRNPNSNDEALKTRAPGKGTVKGMDFRGRFKMTASYRKNPNSSEGALKGIGPSKAAISASNYQGNIKMKKSRMGDKHPSFKFAQSNNSQNEKTKFSFKLLWSKLFKKNENQPKNLKEKEGKPRYDKSEQGIWNE